MPVPFYEIFIALCDDISLPPSKAAQEIGFNKGTVSAWKSGRTSPSNEILLKIGAFFNVPYSFLRQDPPFDCWGEIMADYSGFLKATGLSSEELRDAWGIVDCDFPTKPDELSELDKYNKSKPLVKPIVSFINDYVKEIHHEDGKWTIISKAEAGHLPTRDIFEILDSLRKDLKNNYPFFYKGKIKKKEDRKLRDRLIWAIQLGLDAADGIIKNENKPS